MMQPYRNLCLDRHSKSHLLLVALAITSMALAILPGCRSKKAPDAAKVPDKPRIDHKPIPRALKAEMSSLKPSDHQKEEVPWRAALTLGEISFVVYEGPEAQKRVIEGIGATTVKSINRGSSHAVVASNDQAVVIGFRGTNDAADWLTDAKIMGDRVADGRMHLGFHRAVDVVFDEVYREAMRQGAEKKALWITGHSLGGAMAVAFAYRAWTEKKMMAEGMITFGQPLVFTTSLAQVVLNKYGWRYVRFVNSWDPVTRLLPTYRHAGSRIHLTNDDFTFRKPMIAITAPKDVAADAEPDLMVFEDDDKLEPMSEQEFEAFQNQLASSQAPAAKIEGRAVIGAYIPLLTPHRMETYRERLKTIGAKYNK